MIITAKILQDEMDACPTWANAFAKAYPNGVSPTEEGIWIDLVNKGFGAVLDWPFWYSHKSTYAGPRRDKLIPIIRNHTFTDIPSGLDGCHLCMCGGILENVVFKDLYIGQLDLRVTKIENVQLINCRIWDIRINWDALTNVSFQECKACIVNEVSYWDNSEQSMVWIPKGITLVGAVYKNEEDAEGE